jgi:hypothetical protein
MDRYMKQKTLAERGIGASSIDHLPENFHFNKAGLVISLYHSRFKVL